jgi:hypothetical protein
MPQLNVFTYLSQTTWTMIIFILYYINMKQILIPSLLEIIKLKNNSILLLSNNNKSTLFNSSKYLNI